MSPFIALPGDFYSRGRAGMFWFYLKNEIKMELNGIKWNYFSLRCGPCLRIAPAFNALSNKYPQATFLEVDVHQCQVCVPNPAQGRGKEQGKAQREQSLCLVHHREL